MLLPLSRNSFVTTTCYHHSTWKTFYVSCANEDFDIWNFPSILDLNWILLENWHLTHKMCFSCDHNCQCMRNLQTFWIYLHPQCKCHLNKSTRLNHLKSPCKCKRQLDFRPCIESHPETFGLMGKFKNLPHQEEAPEIQWILLPLVLWEWKAKM